MSDGYTVTPVGGRFSWTVRVGAGQESGISPTARQAHQEVEAARSRLRVKPVMLTPNANPDIGLIYQLVERCRTTVVAVAERPETSKPTVADLSRVQRLLESVLKELD